MSSNRNLDKDNIRDESNLLQIDPSSKESLENTRLEGEALANARASLSGDTQPNELESDVDMVLLLEQKQAVEAEDRWFAKRERIHRMAETLLTELNMRYEQLTMKAEADVAETKLSIQTEQMNANHEESQEVIVIKPTINTELLMTDDMTKRFWDILHRVNGLLINEEQFFGYFYLQMDHGIRYDMPSPWGVNIKGGKYVLYANPFLLLDAPPDVMKDGIKREILHVISAHLTRTNQLYGRFHKQAIHLAMDMVVNDYLEYLDRDAVSVAWVNARFGLQLKRFRTLEFYAKALDVVIKEKPELFIPIEQSDNAVSMEFDPFDEHSIWEESDPIDAEVVDQFTERYINQSKRGDTEGYLQRLIDTFRKTRRSMPWYFYLKKLMGKVASGRKKTTMRRNRRQPERMELSGTLRQHKANVWLALDMSGSITDAEFHQALEQVLQIVHVYSHHVTVVECDNAVRRQYRVADVKDIQPQPDVRGATEFSPVIKLANEQKVDLLVYFTDGKGENHLRAKPKGYKILWVLSGGHSDLSVKEPYGIVKSLGVVEDDERQDIDEFVRMTSRSGFSMANQEYVP